MSSYPHSSLFPLAEKYYPVKFYFFSKSCFIEKGSICGKWQRKEHRTQCYHTGVHGQKDDNACVSPDSCAEALAPRVVIFWGGGIET